MASGATAGVLVRFHARNERVVRGSVEYLHGFADLLLANLKMSSTFSVHALTIALVLALVSCSRNQSAWSPLALDPPQAIPLAWPDANTLIVGYRGSLYRYDLAGRKLGERLAESYAGSYEPNCFGPKAGTSPSFPRS